MHGTLSKGQTHYIRPTSEPPSATFIDGTASQEPAFYHRLQDMEAEKQNRTCPKYKTIFVPEQRSVYLFVFTYSYFLFPSVGLQYVSQAQVVYARMIKTECCRNTPILFSRLCPMASKRQTFCILDVKDKERSPTSNVPQ